MKESSVNLLLISLFLLGIILPMKYEAKQNERLLYKVAYVSIGNNNDIEKIVSKTKK